MHVVIPFRENTGCEPNLRAKYPHTFAPHSSFVGRGENVQTPTDIITGKLRCFIFHVNLVDRGEGGGRVVQQTQAEPFRR